MMRTVPLCFLAFVATGLLSSHGEPLPVAALERDTPVDFSKEIVPFLKKNCFACHNENKAKADLNLESPKAMLQGGDSGPAVVPGEPDESWLFIYAAHLDGEQMPPAKNKANAEDLTADELALLKLWIEQGAKGSAATVLSGPAEWQSLADVHSIYSVAISDDGRFAACGHGNRLAVYDLRTGALAAELQDTEAGMQTAHLDSVHSLAFSPHGVLATGGYRNVKLWERHVNPAARIAHDLPDAPSALDVSGDGEWFALGDNKGNVIVQRRDATEQSPAVQVHGGPVRDLAFAADHSALFSVSDDKTLVRLPLAEPRDPAKIELPNEGLSLALLEGGQQLAVGGSDGVVRLFPLTSFDPRPEGEAVPPPAEIAGHNGKVMALETLDEAGTQILSAGEDGTVRIRDLAGNEVRQINHGAAIVAVDLHRETSRIATAGADGGVRIWDTSNGNKVGELNGNLDHEIRRRAATRTRDLRKRVAELRGKELAENEKHWNEAREKSKEEAAKVVAARKDLDAKAADERAKREGAGQLQREIAALEAAADQEPLKQAQERLKNLEEELNKAVGELANAERAFETATRNSELAVRDGVKAGERFLATQAAATQADAALAAAEEALKAIEEQTVPSGPGIASDLAFSPDGQTIAVSSETGGVRLWSATTFQPLDPLHAAGAGTALRYTPDGTLLAAFADKTLAGWKAPAAWTKTLQLGDPSDPAMFPDRVLALAFHPRGHLLATGSGVPSRNSDVKLWTVRDGTLASIIEKAHRDTITGLAFSPDGARLASGSTDRFVKVHETRTGALVSQLEGHTSHVLDVAWSADGETIASAGADEVAKLWVAAEGRQKKSEEGFKKELTSISFLGTGEDLLLAGGEQLVKAGGQNLGGSEGFVYDVAATPDGAVIVAGGEDGVLRVWQASDRQLLFSFPPLESSSTETAAR